MYAISHFSCVQLFATPWTVAHQAPLYMGILQARILEWVVTPSSRDLSNPGIASTSLYVSCLSRWFFTTSAIQEAPTLAKYHHFSSI